MGRIELQKRVLLALDEIRDELKGSVIALDGTSQEVINSVVGLDYFFKSNVHDIWSIPAKAKFPKDE
jgi:hypothetical protein